MNYWDKRKDLNYYKEVMRLIDFFSPAESILDVGCADTPISTWGMFERRYTVDLRTDPKLAGVESYVGDFTTWVPPEPKFSVVTCLQTIEHLKDEELQPFTSALLDMSENLIVSLPWKWPRSATKTHYQDPIDWNKLVYIMGHEPKEFKVVEDNKLERIVTLY